ncbi:MAG: FKBP-type peptidyl-prolyl cis-trans isomerase [Muribaculaceae bacterium]|nr:FKBP-type peptidyl-prolyl cis-trans isomerase [Muribaculaceae bacterium]
MMRGKHLVAVALAALSMTASALPTDKHSIAPTAADSTSTALAVFIGDAANELLSSQAAMGLPIDRGQFIRALSQYLHGEDPGMNPVDAHNYLTEAYKRMQSEAPKPLPAADATVEAAALAKAASQPGVVVLPTGTVLEVLKEGTGARPTEEGIAMMRYKGTLTDGTVFDEVYDDEEALAFPVSDLAEGLTEALLSGKMKSGGRYVLTIPASAGYGEEGVPGKIPPGATLRFVIDLIDAE